MKNDLSQIMKQAQKMQDEMRKAEPPRLVLCERPEGAPPVVLP